MCAVPLRGELPDAGAQDAGNRQAGCSSADSLRVHRVIPPGKRMRKPVSAPC